MGLKAGLVLSTGRDYILVVTDDDYP